MSYRVTRGLLIPITGEPDQSIDETAVVSSVALVAADYVGLRPTMHVAVGDTVRRGQLLFEDRKLPGVRHTSPAAGVVASINRGARRSLQSVVVTVGAEDGSADDAQVAFRSFSGKSPAELGDEGVRALLLESGLWTALRARPFSRVADPAVRPRSIFVTAIDSEPLAPDVQIALRGRETDFELGLTALRQLTDGAVFVCTSAQSDIRVPAVAGVRHERFEGPHPAGTVGYHIHALDPAGRGRVVWHLGAQDVLAIGRLMATGDLAVDRVVALAGPAVQRPRLMRTRIGASTDDLTAGQLADGEARVVSGSVLTGRSASGPVHGFLGRYHRQVAVLFEGRRRELLGWAAPGLGKFSSARVFASRLFGVRRFPMSTSTGGSPRAIVPIGLYEKVMPFDVEPTYLLKALVMHDVERAEELGCLELDEEDLALCTFVCPGKHEYGSFLRDVLTTLEKDG